MTIKTLQVGEGYFPYSTSFLFKIDNFNIQQIAESGQAFRFVPVFVYPDSSCYNIISRGKLCEIYQSGELVELNLSFVGDLDYWLWYFDIIDSDNKEVTVYGEITDKMRNGYDEVLKKALPESSGIRILNQDFLEMGISFITSCANNIPRISQLINRLCEYSGRKTKVENLPSFYSFPTIQALKDITEEELRELGFGFRAVYIINFIKFYSDLPKGHVPLSKELQTVPGIGEKVASCIELYAFHDMDKIPMDVWMKRIRDDLYDGAFPWNDFSPYRGILQQYVYYYYRTKGGTKNGLTGINRLRT